MAPVVILVHVAIVVSGDFVDVVVELDSSGIDEDRIDAIVGGAEVQDRLDFGGNRELGGTERPSHAINLQRR